MLCQDLLSDLDENIDPNAVFPWFHRNLAKNEAVDLLVRAGRNLAKNEAVDLLVRAGRNLAKNEAVDLLVRAGRNLAKNEAVDLLVRAGRTLVKNEAVYLSVKAVRNLTKNRLNTVNIMCTISIVTFHRTNKLLFKDLEVSWFVLVIIHQEIILSFSI